MPGDWKALPGWERKKGREGVDFATQPVALVKSNTLGTLWRCDRFSEGGWKSFQRQGIERILSDPEFDESTVLDTLELLSGIDCGDGPSLHLYRRIGLAGIEEIIRFAVVFHRYWIGHWSESQFRLGLILRELLTNAVRHGNQCRAEGRVDLHLLWCPTRNRILLCCGDEGTGFDLSGKLGESHKEAELRTGHRGLVILDEYSEKVRIENGKVMVWYQPANE